MTKICCSNARGFREFYFCFHLSLTFEINMNKPKITFGAIKLNVGKPPAAEKLEEEPATSGI